MKKLLQKIYNDMVDLKKQANNRGLERTPYQPPPNHEETLNFEEIYYVFKALTTGSQTVPDDIRDSSEEAKYSLPLDEE